MPHTKRVTENTLHAYLQEIRKIPLLTREEEKNLARNMVNGDHEAREILIRSNLRFVVSIARKYQSSSISMMDLINEGNLGLVYAADKFDPERGCHFISYAVWWIRQAVVKAVLNANSLIRFPAERLGEIQRIQQTNNLLHKKLERLPTVEEVASELNKPRQRINQLMSISQDTLSLDMAIGPQQNDSLQDLLVDKQQEQPHETLEKTESTRLIESLVMHLNEREQKVIHLRYGLDGRKRLSLNNIGKMMGLSKERIRQIEQTALRHMRSYAQQHNIVWSA